jgi:hypothetical protein
VSIRTLTLILTNSTKQKTNRNDHNLSPPKLASPITWVLLNYAIIRLALQVLKQTIWCLNLLGRLIISIAHFKPNTIWTKKQLGISKLLKLIIAYFQITLPKLKYKNKEPAVYLNLISYRIISCQTLINHKMQFCSKTTSC